MVAGNFTLLITKGSFFTEAGLWDSAGASLGRWGTGSWHTCGAVRRTSVSDEFGGQDVAKGVRRAVGDVVEENTVGSHIFASGSESESVVGVFVAPRNISVLYISLV